jgi:hypothetical protein
VLGALAEAVAIVLLLTTLVLAVVRPGGLPEAVVAVPAAGLALAFGILPFSQAADEVRSLEPTIGFLTAVLVLAEMAEREGLFAAAGAWMAAASRGRPMARWRYAVGRGRIHGKTLAERAGVHVGYVHRLVELGILLPPEVGSLFSGGDVRRVRLVRGLEEGGLLLGGIGTASETGISPSVAAARTSSTASR